MNKFHTLIVRYVTLLAVVTAAYTLPSHAATTWYVSTNGTDSAIGTSWTDSFLTISNGLAHAVASDTVVVSNGTYNINTQLVIEAAITLIGTNGQDVTIIDAQGIDGVRCMSIDDPLAVVQGFTIRGGNAKEAPATKGGGILMTGGTVQWCRLEANKAQSGGGGTIWMDGGLVQYCHIVNNLYGYYSGTVYMEGGILRNCLVADNNYRRTAIYINATAAQAASVENCTVVCNAAQEITGGIYNRYASPVVNTIMYFNTNLQAINHNYVDSGTHPYSYCCTTPTPYGATNVEGDPLFIDMTSYDYHLLPGSSCIDVGTTNLSWLAGAVDLDGNPRVVDGKVDIGCYQSVAGSLQGNFVADPLVGLAPHPAVFTAYSAGADLEGVGYQWDFENDGNNDAVGSVVTNLYPAGLFSVSMTTTNAAGESNTYARYDYIKVAPSTNYVSTTGSATFPYDTPTTAANDIQTALDSGIDGTVVLVAEGTYSSANTLNMLDGITLRSISGRAATTLIITTTAVEIRTVYINHADAVLDGFTITAEGPRCGGVLIDYSGGMMQNCEVVGCLGGQIGGVQLQTGSSALVDRCIIRANTNILYDGASNVGGIRVGTSCTLRNSLIIDNGGFGLTGGVANEGTVENCTIVGNMGSIDRSGNTNETACGGLRNNNAGAVTRNCIIVDNLNDHSGAYTNWYRASGIIEYTCTTPDASAYGSDNITANPLLVGSGNYELAPGSTCINAGSVQAWMTDATDLDGNPRIQGLTVDMGAYEYQPLQGTLILIK